MATKKAKRPFKPGDACIRKAKPYCKGVILEAVAPPEDAPAGRQRRSHWWQVEFTSACGVKSREVVTSQRIQWPEDDDAEDRASPAPVVANTDNSRQRAAAPPPVSVDNSGDSDSKSDSDSDSKEEEQHHQSNTGTNRSSRDETLSLASSSDEEDKADEEEELMVAAAPEDAEEVEDVPTHGEIPVEPEEIHKAKWEKYINDKAQLLSEGWTISKKPRNKGIGIDAIVRTRGQNQREGHVSGETVIDGKKHWLVDFVINEWPEPMRPQQLTLVAQSLAQDFEWVLVADSEPDVDMIEEYHDGIGLVGINFNKLFKTDDDSGVYNSPFLQLFQQMWPGDWRQQW
jgi:hypothetical protein